MVALARDELGRCRLALEALAATFDRLIDPQPIAALDSAAGRPAMALAMTLIAYLQAGGRLEPDLALDLSQELAASRARRQSGR
jgi:hypothetical protein